MSRLRWIAAVTAVAAGITIAIPASARVRPTRDPVATPRTRAPAPHPAAARDTAVFAGGCFWGIQAVFERVRGVASATSGYAGGHGDNPSYEEVSTGATGYAESVQVIYDPAQVSYEQLLSVFFAVHDPTELNRQGPDDGTQYRSAVFYRNAAQASAASAYVAKLAREHTFPRPIVTQITALNAFHAAEGYHQRFYDSHPDYPYIVINDKPKVATLKARFATLYVDKG